MEEKNLIIRTPALQCSKIIMQIEITPNGFKIYNEINKVITSYIEKTNIIPESKIQETISFLKTLREDAVKRFSIKFE